MASCRRRRSPVRRPRRPACALSRRRRPRPGRGIACCPRPHRPCRQVPRLSPAFHRSWHGTRTDAGPPTGIRRWWPWAAGAAAVVVAGVVTTVILTSGGDSPTGTFPTVDYRNRRCSEPLRVLAAGDQAVVRRAGHRQVVEATAEEHRALSPASPSGTETRQGARHSRSVTEQAVPASTMVATHCHWPPRRSPGRCAAWTLSSHAALMVRATQPQRGAVVRSRCRRWRCWRPPDRDGTATSRARTR